MVKKIIISVFFLLILLSCSIYFYLQPNSQKTISPTPLPTSQPTTDNRQLTTSKKLDPTITLTPTPVISTKLQSTLTYSEQKYALTFKISDKNSTAFDAADLILEYPQGLTISEIKDGEALDFCPRKAISPEKVEISCLNQLENKNPGQLNKTLVIIYFQTDSVNTKITVDQIKTLLYYAGKSVPIAIEPKEILAK